MYKNVAGQAIGAEMLSTSDGSTFSDTVTVYVTGDTLSQTLGASASGICTAKGNGYFEYLPTQAETNYDHIAFTFIGTDAIAVTIQVATQPTVTEIADALLQRDMSAVTGEASRSPLNAFRFIRNKWAVTGNTLSVKKEDDSTEAWAAAVTSDAQAEPITGSDPE